MNNIHLSGRDFPRNPLKLQKASFFRVIYYIVKFYLKYDKLTLYKKYQLSLWTKDNAHHNLRQPSNA